MRRRRRRVSSFRGGFERDGHEGCGGFGGALGKVGFGVGWGVVEEVVGVGVVLEDAGLAAGDEGEEVGVQEVRGDVQRRGPVGADVLQALDGVGPREGALVFLALVLFGAQGQAVQRVL